MSKERKRDGFGTLGKVFQNFRISTAAPPPSTAPKSVNSGRMIDCMFKRFLMENPSQPVEKDYIRFMLLRKQQRNRL